MGEAPDHGNFGSVVVEQASQYGEKKPVLSFLLNKVTFFKVVSYHDNDWHLHVRNSPQTFGSSLPFINLYRTLITKLYRLKKINQIQDG